jgi:hypothetical protein
MEPVAPERRHGGDEHGGVDLDGFNFQLEYETQGRPAAGSGRWLTVLNGAGPLAGVSPGPMPAPRAQGPTCPAKVRSAEEEETTLGPPFILAVSGFDYAGGGGYTPGFY